MVKLNFSGVWHGDEATMFSQGIKAFQLEE